MDLKICLKKLFRTPAKTFLFLLLLTLTGTLLSLGVSLLISAKNADKNIKESFTTIAIPDFDRIKTDAIDTNKKIFKMSKEEIIDSVESINKLYYKVLGQASETKIGNVDLRNSYLAYSKDLSTVLFEPYTQRRNMLEWSLTYNMAVLDLTYGRSRTIRYDKSARWYKPDVHEDEVVIIWSINDALALHPSYEIPDNIETNTKPSHKEKFEFGKRYLVAGYIKNLKTIYEEVALGAKYIDTINYFRNYSFTRFPFDTDVNYIPEQVSNDYFISYVELDNNVDIDEFLNSERGAKFKQLIENCQFINQAANVIATDNVSAILQFNQKKAHIVSGREITKEEYENGQNVCIVGWKYAESNNLKTGDEINFSLASANYEYDANQDFVKDSIWFLNTDPFSTTNSKEQSFKIVGIYQAPKWEISEFMLSPNTIFVPSKSVDSGDFNQDSNISNNKESEHLNQIPTANYSIIIPSEKLEEFKSEMEQKGIDKYFLYYDQGYSSVKSVVKVLTQNAMIILSTCFAVWLLILIIFILLYIVKEKKVAGIMLSLGVGTRRTFAHLLISCMLLILPAVIFGGITSNVLESAVSTLSYDMAVNQVMDKSFNRKFSANANTSYNILNENSSRDNENLNSMESLKFNALTLIIGFMQFVFIICLCSVSIYFIIRKNPMELVKSKE
jgi:hypothetical protein